MKNWIKKKFKQYLGWSTSKKWYPVVLILSSLYVFYYRYEIYDFSQLNARNLIFLLWLLIMLLPLFSEFEFMGIKLKREIEKVTAEVKESAKDLKLQMMQLQVSTKVENNYNYNPPLSTDEERENMEEELKNSNKNLNLNTDMGPDEIYDKIDNSIVYLFKVRLSIEKKLRDIYNNHYIGEPLRKYSAGQLAQILYQMESISREEYPILREVLNITTYAVHGEVICDKDVKFVRNHYPEIMSHLSQIG